MKKLISLLAASALVVAGLVWFDASSSTASTRMIQSKVRLYSEGQVVGEWLASGPGRVEGSTFVFPVRKGARDLDVRISGTFSFEHQP